MVEDVLNVLHRIFNEYRCRGRNVCLIPQVLPPASLKFALFRSCEKILQLNIESAVATSNGGVYFFLPKESHLTLM